MNLENSPDELEDEVHVSRMTLIWQTLVFQVKLVADGLRDVILVPVSLIASLAGLIAGGQDPGRYFRYVMHLGRLSERWINLFGYRRSGTADELLNPLKERVDASPIAQKAGQSLNKSLDVVNEQVHKAREANEESSRDA